MKITDPAAEMVKKLSTKNERTKKAIRRSLEIHGEVDGVTSRDKDKFNATVATLTKKGVNLTEEQLRSILSIIQNPSETKSNQPKPQTNSNELDLANYRQPQVVSHADHDISANKSNSFEKLNNLNVDQLLNTKNKMLPSEMKRLKWQRDKELQEQMARQEVYDTEKFKTALEREIAEKNRVQAMNRSGMTPEPTFFKSTLTLAEKKRLEWQHEKSESQFLILPRFYHLKKKGNIILFS
jgi:hypothetical protein